MTTRDPLDTAHAAIDTAGASLTLLERLAALFRVDPRRKAARLRRRASKLRARAAAIAPLVPEVYLSRRERLRRQADALEAQAKALEGP